MPQRVSALEFILALIIRSARVDLSDAVPVRAPRRNLLTIGRFTNCFLYLFAILSAADR
jgi:hypothetical protein